MKVLLLTTFLIGATTFAEKRPNPGDPEKVLPVIAPKLTKDETCKKISIVNQLNAEYEKNGRRETVDQLLAEVDAFDKSQYRKDCGEMRFLSDAFSERKKAYQRAAKGDETALYFLFKLQNYADGAFAEELDIGLGVSIEKHPEAFLKSLKAVHGDAHCSEGVLGNDGHYDDTARDLKMLKSRQKALETVKRPELKKLKDVCVGVLRKLIQRDQQILKDEKK